MSTKPLRIIKPIAIGGAQLVSSTVPEDDYAAWDAATAYSIGDRVIRAATHRIYQRVVAGTTATAPELDPANWLDIGATNRWRMFDETISSQTTSAGDIVIVLAPGSVFNGVAVLNVMATSVRIRVIDSVDGVVYEETTAMSSPISSSSYWVWCFETPSLRTKMVADDLPSYGRTAQIEITLGATAAGAACGICVVGVLRQIGDFGIRAGAQVGITDYSRKEKNEFGQIQIVERSWSDRSSFSMLIPNRQLDSTKNLFAAIRATPVVWIASRDFDALVLYGIYKDFSAVIAYPEDSECNLEIEGLI